MADSVFPACITPSRNMTVAAFKQRLSRFRMRCAESCGTPAALPVIFWRWTKVSRKTISMRAMAAQHCHDANVSVQLD